ncbi:UbiX family flavin prenyltransferase [Amycolatopsis alkalitolerans]|uniref:Flavin prenyltransferase UbiX n=1 Tax=Amycolatopsis alkalitolerans TaxID=2547244 RepID=A0A5C4LXN6_9PSEU|nr:UbiX family flavin prenyltransferase [Amycolatopsis alkalitolerans]TNC24194.1 UbiX family flavin prenyltransferase [Amycolatopsis alkalitolerans]
MTNDGEDRSRLVVGMSGSSAPQLGIALLTELRAFKAVETHFVLSEGARRSIELEAGLDPDQVASLADVSYDPRDLGAAIASGSFLTQGMVVVPCSMRTLSNIATGNSDNLLTRAADVTLKERRRLVLVARESPLNLVHIRNMETVTLAGATVFPPVLALYHRPASVDELISQIVGKVLDQFGIAHTLFRRWGE